MIDTAVILAGGKGTRLKPYSTIIPKPLLPVGDKAIVEILIDRLCASGILKIYLCVNHLAELIHAFLGDGSKFGVSIEYSLEDRPLSTVAPIKLLHGLPDDFFVMNGDLLTDLNFSELSRFHLDHKELLTVAACRRSVGTDFGVIDVDPVKETACGFREKPNIEIEVSMGVYVFKKRLLEYVPSDRPYGFDTLMLDMLKENRPVAIFRYAGFWLDIGRPDDYQKANEEIGQFMKHKGHS